MIGDDSRLLAISALLTAITITAAELERKDELPTTRQWSGLALAFLLMSAFSDLGIPIGGGLAMILFVSTLLVRGPDAVRFAMGTTAQRRRRRQRQPRDDTMVVPDIEMNGASPQAV